MTPSTALAPSYSGRLKEEKTMGDVFSRVHRFVVSEDGPTAVEYAVLMGLIVVAIAAAVGNLAKSISGTFSAVSSTLGAS
jgi:pilus assembly protein Flp/PilA